MDDLVRLNLGIIKRSCETCKYGGKAHGGAKTKRKNGESSLCWHPGWLAGIDKACYDGNHFTDWEPQSWTT